MTKGGNNNFAKEYVRYLVGYRGGRVNEYNRNINYSWASSSSHRPCLLLCRRYMVCSEEEKVHGYMALVCCGGGRLWSYLKTSKALWKTQTPENCPF